MITEDSAKTPNSVSREVYHISCFRNIAKIAGRENEIEIAMQIYSPGGTIYQHIA